MRKINCVLLVDDSDSTNFYNDKIIKESNSVTAIFAVENGEEALDFINKEGNFITKGNIVFPYPNIIYLDINMPKMDGFEFLENYAKLPEDKRKNTIIILLTTSNWSKDRERALDTGLVYDFIEKPLKKEELKKINNYYISNYM